MNKAEIAQAGFAAVRRSPRRIIANIQSIKKSVGKTRLALTGGKPVGYISVEIGGDEGVMDQFIPDGKELSEDIFKAEIRMENPAYPNPEDYDLSSRDGSKKYDEAISAAVQAVAQPAMDAFYGAYYYSIANMRTTVIDTATDLYRLMRLASFGRTEKIPQLAYTAVNSEFAKMMDDAFSAKGSVLFISHMKDKGAMVEDDKGKKTWQPTGVFETDGCRVLLEKVQANIEMWREDLTEADEKTGRMVRFWAQVVDSRHNPDSMGVKFCDDEVSFSSIGQAIILGSKESDWK